jgi:hypothetical protein
MRADLSRRVEDLPRVAAGSDTLYFYNPGHDPFELGRFSERGVEAYELATQIDRLRAGLGDVEGIESALLGAVRRHGNTSDEQRLGAVRLAEELLGQIKPSLRE